jgi:protein-tyrosine phosphatase
VRVMAATPHLRSDFPAVRVEELESRVRALQAAIDAAGVELQVVSGGEVDVLWAQNASDDALRAASYGGLGTDLLVETPYGELPPIFEDLLFKIRVRGFRVLLAHPERNRSFQQDPARLERLDVLVQVTAASVVGGGRAGKLAQRLIAEGQAHVIAGDLHRAGGSRASLREAAAAVGGERAEWMVNAAPAAILEGRPLPPAPAAPAPRRRSWLRRGA